MKKFFVLMLALALFVPAVASAQVNWYGQLDVFGYSIDDESYSEPGTSNTYSRVILGANFDLAENIEGNMSLMYFGTWGDNYLAGQQIDNSNDTGVLSTTRITEANVVFKNLFDNDRISAKVGRQYYNGGTFFNVGPRDLVYSYLLIGMIGMPYPETFTDGGMDGVVATYDNKENLKIDAGYSKMINENTPAGIKLNTTFINANYKFNDMWKVQGYLYDSEYADGSDYLRFEILGAKPEFTLGKLAAALEIAQVFGDDDGSMFSTRRTADGYFAKLDASYDLNPLKVRGMYFMTGSEFWMPYTQNLYTGIYFTSMFRMMSGGGFFAEAGSLDCLNLGADYTISKFKFALDYYRLGDRDVANKMYEADFTVQYNYKENVNFKGGIAYLGFEEDGSEKHMIYVLSAGYKFGGK
ncbi:MAG: hypothetical protein PHN29_05695 [Endomicrobiaceae bacterium]|nr:hypothetical protein [Endomicrobiaceae bacterium]